MIYYLEILVVFSAAFALIEYCFYNDRNDIFIDALRTIGAGGIIFLPLFRIKGGEQIADIWWVYYKPLYIFAILGATVAIITVLWKKRKINL